MSIPPARCLARAWSAIVSKNEWTLHEFLSLAVRELQHAEGVCTSLVGIAVCDTVSALQVSVSESALPFASPTISGLMNESFLTGKKAHIVDHSLDGGRHLGHEIRTSLIVQLDVTSELSPSGRGALWFGFGNGRVLSGGDIEALRSVGEAVAEWIRDYAPLIAKISTLMAEKTRTQRKEHELLLFAHDARAPLSAMRYHIADQMSNSGVGVRTESFAREIEYLDRLLSGVADTARGGLSHQTSGCDVVAVAKRCISRFSEQAKSRGIDLRSEILVASAEVPVPTLALERILSNLVGNGVQYTDVGSVTLSISPEGSEIAIRVVDSGKGVPLEVLAELENPDRYSVSKPHGWGMGLLSVKRSVLENDGQFRVFSAIHGGAVFELVFPCLSVSTECLEEKQTIMPTPKDSPIVLLVDDDEEQALSLKRVLQLNGVEALYAATVADALVALKGSEVSAVVCDSNMPDGGARTLLSQMRELAVGCRVAVMSGDSGEDSIYQFAAHGAEAFFQKPAEVSEIVGWVRGVAG